MLSIKDLKKRIVSVKNTQQTTKAMKMVSAAKLRRAQDAILHQRPYALGLLHLTQKVAHQVSSFDSFPLVQTSEQMDKIECKKLLIVVLTLDRGLCGGFNANVVKKAFHYIEQNSAYYNSIEVLMIGKKGFDAFRSHYLAAVQYHPEFAGKVSFRKAIDLSESLIQKYLIGEVTEVKFIYNQFINALSQRVVVEDYLPLLFGQLKTDERLQTDFVIKPTADEVLESLLKKNFQMQAFKILLESQASEHGARMSAMESATKNASEMIHELTLDYNKQRQANITKELLEIIAGSESQKDN